MGTEKRARQKAGRQARIEAAMAAQQRAQTRSKVIRAVVAAAIIALLVGGYSFIKRDDSKTVEASASTSSTAPGTTTAPGPAPAVVPAPPPGKEITGDTPCPAADGSTERATKFAKAPPTCIDPTKTYTATFDTSKGAEKVVLDAAKMPSTTNNFVVLSRYRYYDNTALFRVDPTIEIIQGGAPTSNTATDAGPGYTIPDEGGKFTYKEGQLVMARTDAPNSSGAQFFLSSGAAVSGLDANGNFLSFGTVTEGLDVLKAIQDTGVPFPAGSPMSGLGNGPKEPVIINSVKITEA
jgi:cyclophilin family peptidyl-prolyl cis-trans isomerase